MAKFLTTPEVSSQIETIIKEAKTSLFILSPYISLRPILFERLRDAGNRNVKITLIYGKSELAQKQEDLLAKLPGLDLRFYDNLHAKCYFNEDLMVITSMNIYNFSEKTNREMGVLITRGEDKEVYKAAVEEVHSILNHSKRERLDNVSKVWEQVKQWTAMGNSGFCIRCGEKIGYDPEKPYCQQCYDVWAEFQNLTYEEKHCHKCGKPATTLMAKPLCISCFRKS